MATPARITNNTQLPTDGKAAGTANDMPVVDRTGSASKVEIADGPKQRENGSYAPSTYKLDSGNLRTDY